VLQATAAGAFAGSSMDNPTSFGSPTSHPPGTASTRMGTAMRLGTGAADGTVGAVGACLQVHACVRHTVERVSLCRLLLRPHPCAAGSADDQQQGRRVQLKPSRQG
jgi:hypothetical protein